MGLSGELAAASLRLIRTAAAEGWRGPDPYDGLGWNWPKPLVGGRRRRQLIVQLHARSPFDVRRLYRREHRVIAKTLGVFASAALRLGEQELAHDALERLDADRIAGEAAWGYPWDVQTRWSFYPAGSPNVVVTSFAAAALLASGEERYAERARRAARWVLSELWQPGGFFAYHPHSHANVHNANLLGAALVWEALGHDATARDRAARAVERTLAAQRPDGSFPYGEDAALGWVDSFHTGYVLICLDRLREADPAVGDAIARGARHYERFFGEGGRAKLWATRRYPEDAHAAGTGLSALSRLAARGEAPPELVERVAHRVLERGLLPDGHAVARRHRWGRTTVRYPRWCDAHVALGLADAATRLAAGAERAAPAARGR